MSDIKFVENITESSLIDCLEWYKTNKYTSIILLAGYESYIDIEGCLPVFKQSDLQIAGGMFPVITFGKNQYTKGAILIGFRGVVTISLLSVETEEITFCSSHSTSLSAIVFLDALSKYSEKHIDVLNRVLDPNIPVIGMGSGALDFIHRPVLFTNSGFTIDHSLLITTQVPIHQNTVHGYEAIAGPFLATKTAGTVTHELNYQTAFDVYLKSVEDISLYSIGIDNFYEWAKSFPLGIENADGSFIIRDAITTDGESFTCVGSIPQSSVIYIMRGEVENLINESQKTAKTMYQEFVRENQKSPKYVFSIDCISRKLFLEDDFQRELLAINTIQSKEHFGVLSLGEISNFKASNATLLNKTLVLGLI